MQNDTETAIGTLIFLSLMYLVARYLQSKARKRRNKYIPYKEEVKRNVSH
jgi:hypothetical protein